MSLNTEWRPGMFSDVVGQGLTPEILRKQIMTNKTGHAYLFTGNRGSGKTTTARIVAKAVNCLDSKNGEPCGKCDNCKAFENGSMQDVIELDAASNNGVDSIRNIINNIQYGPTFGKYKVYIIDEAHMLTTGASNAFLKTLEEPPKYAIFILATTDPQKLPITILSRCQGFDFRRIPADIIADRLRHIIRQENFKVEDKAVVMLSRLADGAMRDGISLLEQVVSDGSVVTYQKIVDILGIATSQKVNQVLLGVFKKDTLKVLDVLNEVVNEGKDLFIFLQEIMKGFRNLLMTKLGHQNLIMSDEDLKLYSSMKDTVSTDVLLMNLNILQDVEKNFKLSSNQRTLLEMALIKMTADTSENVLLKKIEELKLVIENLQKTGMPVQAAFPQQVETACNNDGNKNEVEPDFNTMEPSVESMDIVDEEQIYSEELKETKQLIIAKESVIKRLREFQRTQIADALVRSQLRLLNNTLYIQNSEEGLCDILLSQISNLENGFSKFLDQKIEVEIVL